MSAHFLAAKALLRPSLTPQQVDRKWPRNRETHEEHPRSTRGTLESPWLAPPNLVPILTGGCRRQIRTPAPTSALRHRLERLVQRLDQVGGKGLAALEGVGDLLERGCPRFIYGIHNVEPAQL